MYGQLLMYLIDFGMVEEFFFFLDLIKDVNPDTLSRLSYYEMLLWIRVNNEVKIQELCRDIENDDSDDKSSFRDISAENISKFIYEYVISIPNLAVDDVIIKFHELHAKLEVLPTSAQFEKLIRYSCDILKVHEALSLADEAWKSDLTLSLETFHPILDACVRSCEYNMVHDIKFSNQHLPIKRIRSYSLEESDFVMVQGPEDEIIIGRQVHQIKSTIYRHKLKPNNETFRMMVQLCVRMKDFEGAYRMISDLQTMKLMPTSSMFNAIMAGYFREKNTSSAMHVLEQMEDAEVKPDALTFTCLIINSQSEKYITENYNDMLDSGIQATKQVFMALVNAYAACGEFDKAKQVIFDKRIPVKKLNEIKSALVGALASYGQLSGALNLYEEIKEADCHLDPKAIRCLIEN